MESGVDKVKEISLLQRDNIIQQVAESSLPVPEARFDKLSPIGEVNMKFTTAMQFPDDLKDIISAQKE